ncbi:MAG: helix-turn-helix domain-containing protein [Pirellulales bacterium]|nr:helix-turn-helix domain-containing protein [Pirellulales bacterium]MBL7193155.1 helix-turn-helix domain-containing protein [Pirellulales bacterium]
MHAAGLSYREIGRRLGIHRETVSRYARMESEAVSKPSKVPISPAGSAEPVDGFEVPTGSAAETPLRRGGRGSWNSGPVG